MSHSSANGASRSRRRVVIVGGGFGGFEAARRLGGADVDVTVVDRNNHLLFQPLIYAVAAGGLSAGDVASPIRWMLRRHQNTSVLMAAVTDVDVSRRQVVLDRGERIDYDNLIVACGAATSYFGNDAWANATCAMKTLDDAVNLRNHIFGAFEEAERAPDDVARDEWLTFVVVGGGPTGVEISGQLAILARHAMRRDFRRIDVRGARVILLDAGERVVAAFSERTSARAAKELADLGVTVRERALVTEVDARGVTIKIGEQTERIASRTVIRAAGGHTAEVAGALARAAGVSTDRGGRIEVNPDLTVPGHPEISVIGDAANLAGPDGKPLPGLATVAIQQARHVARGIGAAEWPTRRVDAVQVPRQGSPGGGGARQGSVRSTRSQTLWRAGISYVLRRPSVLFGGRPRETCDGSVRGDGSDVREPEESGNERQAGGRRAHARVRRSGGSLSRSLVLPWPTT